MSLKNSINKLRQAMAASLNMNEDPSVQSTPAMDPGATEIQSMDCENCCIYATRRLPNGTPVYAIRCGRPPNMTLHYMRAVMGGVYGVDSVDAMRKITGCPNPRCASSRM
jgi:hypothetical protein